MGRVLLAWLSLPLAISSIANAEATKSEPAEPAVVAQAEVTATEVKPPVVNPIVWKATGQLGAYGSTGNAQTITVNGALNTSRDDGWNKIALDVLGAYSQAWVRAAGPVDTNGNGQIDVDERNAVNNRKTNLSAGNWLTKLRYDRLFTKHNAGYVLAFAGQDYVVQKDALAGGGLGYSGLILRSQMNELAAEVGYDLAYTHYQSDTKTPWTLIHAARLFVGYVLTLRKDTAINASVEALVNCNPVDVGPAGDPNTHKGFGEASRVIGKLGLTTVLYKRLSFKVGFTVKYDNAPSPVGVVLPEDTAGNPLPYAPGVAVLRNDKVDFIGEAAIVVSFL